MKAANSNQPSSFPFEATNTVYKVKCKLENEIRKHLVLFRAELRIAILLRCRTDVSFEQQQSKVSECITQTIWKSDKLIGVHEPTDTEVEFSFPIQIDPNEKIRSCSEWPRPTQLLHDEVRRSKPELIQLLV